MPRWNRMLRRSRGAQRETSQRANQGDADATCTFDAGSMRSAPTWPPPCVSCPDLLMLYPKNSVTICALPLIVMVFFVDWAVRDMAERQRERGWEEEREGVEERAERGWGPSHGTDCLIAEAEQDESSVGEVPVTVVQAAHTIRMRRMQQLERSGRGRGTQTTRQTATEGS